MNEHWIKLSMSIFDNRKIKMIMRGRNGYRNFVIWVKLLCLAGKLADDGLLYVVKELPYSDADLAAEIDVSRDALAEAMGEFIRLGMVVMNAEGLPRVKNFTDYQSIDELRSIREYHRVAKQKQRERKRAEALAAIAALEARADSTVADVRDKSATSLGDGGGGVKTATDKEIKNNTEFEIREEREKREETKKTETEHETESPSAASAVGAPSSVSDSPSVSAPAPAPARSPHGKFSNVFLSEGEMSELNAQYGAETERVIEELSSYIASYGERYKSHYATLVRWLERGRSEPHGRASSASGAGERVRFATFDPMEVFQRRVMRSYEEMSGNDKK